MRHLLTILLSLMFAVAYAQTEKYTAEATCQRDMRTQIYGKTIPSNIIIEKTGNSSVVIADKVYSVIAVDRQEEKDSIGYKQYTVSDAEGKEYVIVFIEDIYNNVELMKHQVVIFNTNTPYDWTYYFVKRD